MSDATIPCGSGLAREVTLQVRALEAMGLEALRLEWRRRLGTPPQTRSAVLLRLILAWHLQEQAFGGLDRDLRKRLRANGRSAPEAISPGAKLVREWQGKRHEVVVGADGFIYGGKTYRSLSAIARVVAGSRWNGPRFFGLRADEESA